MQCLKECINEIRAWMSHYKLKLNDDKTEFLVMSSSRKVSQFSDLELEIGDSSISTSQSARNLGVVMDNVMSMDKQVNAICKSAHHQLRSIGAMRKYLTVDVTRQLIHAFVTSRLDYCNSLLYGISDKSMKKLRRVQNTAARIVTLSRKYDHITPILKTLHWLPVNLRIEFKILLLTYKSLNELAPVYLRDLLVKHEPSRALRSSNKNLLALPSTKTKATYGDKAFSNTAPRLWNSLPIEIRNANSVHSFKRLLKTFLFTKF